MPNGEVMIGEHRLAIRRDPIEVTVGGVLPGGPPPDTHRRHTPGPARYYVDDVEVDEDTYFARCVDFLADLRSTPTTPTPPSRSSTYDVPFTHRSEPVSTIPTDPTDPTAPWPFDDASTVESAEHQVYRLGQAIIDLGMGEPSRPEGAVDTAIRLLRQWSSEPLVPISTVAPPRYDDDGAERFTADHLVAATDGLDLALRRASSTSSDLGCGRDRPIPTREGWLDLLVRVACALYRADHAQ